MTGTHARRLDFDEGYASRFLTSLDHLYALLTILRARIAFVLSPAATSAHALPGNFEKERVFIMRSCVHTLELAWASLTLPIFIEIKRRIELLKALTTLTGEKKRLKERLTILLNQIHSTTLVGAKIVAKCLSAAPSLAFLTHLQQERIPVWATILLETKTLEQGYVGITRKEKIECLKWMNDGLKMIGWSWSTELEIIDQELEGALNSLQLDEMLGPNTINPNTHYGPNQPPSAPPTANGIFHLSPSSSINQPTPPNLPTLQPNHIFGLSPPSANSSSRGQTPPIDFSTFFNSTTEIPNLLNGNAVANPLSPDFNFGGLMEEEDGMKLDEWTNV